MGRTIWSKLYLAWAALAIASSIAIAGLSPESVTRLFVVGFLLLQWAFRHRLARALPGLPPRLRYVVLGTLLAAVVEGFHMVSAPVFLSLRVDAATPPLEALRRYALDLLVTLPAYLVIFTVMGWFVARYRYDAFPYLFGFGLAQALGDGGIFFFLASPPMLAFLPYPMTNYHAVNVMPFLAVRRELPGERAAGPLAWLAVPAVIGTYLVCGSIIKVVGRWWGLEPA